MDTKRYTTKEGECLFCKNCIEHSNCEAECNAINICIKKLAEYETAEEEGRLVVLPCKVGDTVYFPNKYAEIIIPFTIVEFCMFKDEYAIIDDSDNEYKIEDFGKAVFLTHEEAEKALEEMKK